MMMHEGIPRVVVPVFTAVLYISTAQSSQHCLLLNINKILNACDVNTVSLNTECMSWRISDIQYNKYFINE